jgi:amidase/aspartyl-tRNA(Asn)/glutamyl-tRNA(Gln) amidotransferase subunit A
MTANQYLTAQSDEALCFESVAQLSHRLGSGEISARELVTLHLGRIDRLNADLTAYVTVLHEEALAAADASDARRAAGASRGVLDGIPVSVKDVEPMSGVRFTMGLKPFSDNVSDFDPLHVVAFRDAGAVILGKTNTPEMGHKGITDNLLFGPTRNPHSLRHNAGGSSGGAAASVAAGLAVLAQGSDGGGSVRIPAAMTGLVGLKSSAGRVPEVRRPNAFQSSTPYQSIGVLTRTVADTAVGTAALEGYNSRDPHSVHAFDLPQREHTVIGFAPTFGDFPIEVDVAGLAAAFLSGLDLPGVAVERVDVALPNALELAHLWRRLISVQTAHNAAGFLERGVDLLGAHRADIPVELAALIELGASLSAVDHARDHERRSVVFDAIELAFEHCDVIATPTLAVAGVENGEWGRTVGPTSIHGVEVEPTIGWTLTHPLNLSGHPAITVPIGFTTEGLPVGLQLVGRRWDDAGLTALAAAIEASLF